MTKTRGQQFLDSLQDGRSVWLDVFDTLNQSEIQDQVGFISPKTGEFVHNSFLVPRSNQELIQRRTAFTRWANDTHGVMSRLSEYAR